MIFIIVRYSVLSKGKSWHIARSGDFNDYRKKLFDEARLAQHAALFREYAFKSILNQKNVDFENDVRVLILTSEELPLDALNELKDIVGERSWTKIVPVGVNEDKREKISSLIKSELLNRETSFATVRFDDDDALHPHFLESISKYVSHQFQGHVISFPKGYATLMTDPGNRKKIVEAISLYYPNNAQGLTFISHHHASGKLPAKNHIFQTGNHTKVDDFFPVVLDLSINAYIRMCYKEQDTAGQFYVKWKKKSRFAPVDNILSEFEL